VTLCSLDYAGWDSVLVCIACTLPSMFAKMVS